MNMPVSIDRNSPIPLHFQLAQVLRRKIESGAYGPGDKLPTELELVRDFSVSQITVRQSLDHLAKEKLISRERGRGTFVRAIPASPRRTSPADGAVRYRRIACIVPWSTESIFAELVIAVEHAAHDRGYQLILVNNRDNPEIEMVKLRELTDHGVDGIVWIVPTNNPNEAMMRKVRDGGGAIVGGVGAGGGASTVAPPDAASRRPIPIVLVDRRFPELGVDFVGSDNAAGVRQAVRHLAEECGCRNLVYIKERTRHMSATSERHDGMIAACRELVLPDPLVLSSRGKFAENGRLCARKLLPLAHQYDGAISQTANAGAAFIEELRSAGGLRAPQDLQVVCFDTNDPTIPCYPPMTSIRQRFDLIGEKAAEVLIGRIEGSISGAAQDYRVRTDLVVRQSTDPKIKAAREITAVV